MLAICSDLDETPDAETYFELMRFLNTTEDTTMGAGVGLEVGNTIYFDMPPGHFSYWNTTDECREKIRALIRSGHIDCLHSFGDLATTRGHAGRALEELWRHECHLPVWIDHARAPTNFGADIMGGHGDEPGHPAYHADLTRDYGVRHVWRGRVTSVIGQDRAYSLRGVPNPREPVSSAVTLAKSVMKQTLAHLGNPKYGLHAGNRLTKSVKLRDGSDTIEFIRCNPHWGGVSCADRGDAIQEVLNRSFLDCLVARGGSCILYTHLGKLARGPFGRMLRPEAVEAFRMLAEYHRTGKIVVTTTARLLDWRRAGDGAAGRDRWGPLDFPALGRASCRRS